MKLMVSLAKTGNMTRSAQALHLTQSALSHQLRDAEERVGAPLFIRKNKTLILTGAGQQLTEFSQDILGRMERGMKSIRESACLETRKLRIKTGCYTSFSWLPSVAKQYAEKYPSVEMEMGGVADSPVGEVKEGKADVGITTDNVKDRKIAWLPLFQDEICLVMPPSHPLAHKKQIHPKELDGQDIVIYNIPDEESTLITEIMKPAGAKPGRVTRVELTEGIIELVKAGLGIGILADWAVAKQVASGELVVRKVGSVGFIRTWKAIMRKQDQNQPHILDYLELLKLEMIRRTHSV